MEKQNVLVVFGGVSPEHEVSVITGLQVLENIDRDLFLPYPLYIDKDGISHYIEGINTRTDFHTGKLSTVFLGRDEKGAFLQLSGKLIGSKRIPIDLAYLAFHGGGGEGGMFQGMLETLQIPFTSPDTESSSISMNKALTREVLFAHDLPAVRGRSFLSRSLKADHKKISTEIETQLGLPVIIKPVHYGSSIGINVAKTSVELEKYLLEATALDSEVLIEELLIDFVEYNVSVRAIKDELEVSEIEKPISQDEILSFSDKYERGGKKTGGDGMASLQRELPAKISESLRENIRQTAKQVFLALRCKGMVRIDFMVDSKENLYVTEVNSIPGSMSFYLWEASGITFKQQITDLLNQAEEDFEEAQAKTLDYESDILDKFVKAQA